MLAVVSTALAAFLRFVLIRRAGYVFSSYVGYLIPIFGLFYGAVLLDEMLSAPMLVAVAMVAGRFGPAAPAIFAIHSELNRAARPTES